MSAVPQPGGFFSLRSATWKVLSTSTLKRLGLDTDPAARLPQNQQIILLNASELELRFPSASGSTVGGLGG